MEETAASAKVSSNNKGENYELRAELNSEYRDKRKEAVKQVIANMTVGKDVSSLFADLVKNMQTLDMELKKLIYLYLINYAKTQPELVILAVNTFVKDSDDPNPLVRSLALRTMGCLRVERITDYLLEPVRKGLADRDPYVRKTAALCVPKLFDLNPAIAIDNGLIGTLQDMLTDKNPMVIANVVCALSEINGASKQKDVFVIDESKLASLLAALNECTEWGQIAILEAISTYIPQAPAIADLVDRIVPRLQHSNSSVVLAAVKTLMVFHQLNYNPEINALILKKIEPSLVTLLSSESEIQFVVLRNISLLLQVAPQLLSAEIHMFFIKYNDPLYIKLEKLHVLGVLCTLDNYTAVALELVEYCNEVDLVFARTAVKTLGRLACRLPGCSEQIVHALVELLKTGRAHLVAEALVVMADILRTFKNQYAALVPTLVELETDDARARAAVCWMVGEFVAILPSPLTALERFEFSDEPTNVQLALLTATVKCFLHDSGIATHVQDMLKKGTESENPDIRDRGYLYWRLLSTPNAKVVFFNVACRSGYPVCHPAQYPASAARAGASSYPRARKFGVCIPQTSLVDRYRLTSRRGAVSRVR